MWSTEQNPINVFLVHERKMVPQHELCIRMVLTPKVRLDSNETARLATTTRALPIPESGPSISNQTLLIFRKTVHNCRRTNIASWATTIEVVATYEHTGAGPMSARSLCFSISREKLTGVSDHDSTEDERLKRPLFLTQSNRLRFP